MLNKFLVLFFAFWSLHAFAAAKDLDHCESLIPERICLVDAPLKEIERYKNGRHCLVGSDKYIAPVLEAYQQYPNFIKQQFCSIQKIYIEKSFFGPAWSALENEKDSTSGLIGLREKDFIMNRAGLQDYATWFEQQSFTANDDYIIRKNLPRIIVLSKHKKTPPFLTSTLLHEIGHLLDYSNHFNSEKCNSENNNSCLVPTQSWTSISWKSIQTPKNSSDFPMRKIICLNNCKGKFISNHQARNMYELIYKHGFISQLSVQNAMEDFADSFAYYVMSEYMDIHYLVQPDRGPSYFLDEVLHAPAFMQKRMYLENIISDLRY